MTAISRHVRWTGFAPFVLVAAMACQGGSTAQLGRAGNPAVSEAAQKAIADTLTGLIASAYDLSNRQGVVDRIMHLYADSGPVILSVRRPHNHLSGYPGAGDPALLGDHRINMQNPHWEWGTSTSMFWPPMRRR